MQEGKDSTGLFVISYAPNLHMILKLLLEEKDSTMLDMIFWVYQTN